MKIIECEQYSNEWWSNRVGILTASSFSKVVTSTGKKARTFRSTAFKVAAEIEMGKTEQGHTNEWMERGHELEAEARNFYNFITNENVEEIGFVIDEDLNIGCSPDGVGIGGLEIKCPSPGVHMKYRYNNKLPTEYAPQVYGSLMICDELKHWDFFSYHPEMKPFLYRVDRSDEGYRIYSESMNKYIKEFNYLVEDIIKNV